MYVPTTSCPACGQAIHVVAGRCKHCKADLTQVRKEEARAARAAARMRAQAAKSADAPPKPHPSPAAAAPRHQAPRARAPAPRRRSLSTWSRSWPKLVMTVALLAIGVSAGMLLERWRIERREEGGRQAVSSSSPPLGSAPRQLPDRIPQPSPAVPLPQRIPDPSPSAPPSAPRSSPDSANAANEVDLFATALSDSLCEKLDECGLIHGQAQSLCEVFAQNLQREAPTARVQRGECSYDAGAADRCLAAIDRLECNAPLGAPLSGGSDSTLDWLLTASSLASCADVFSCR